MVHRATYVMDVSPVQVTPVQLEGIKGRVRDLQLYSKQHMKKTQRNSSSLARPSAPPENIAHRDFSHPSLNVLCGIVLNN